VAVRTKITICFIEETVLLAKSYCDGTDLPPPKRQFRGISS